MATSRRLNPRKAPTAATARITAEKKIILRRFLIFTFGFPMKVFVKTHLQAALFQKSFCADPLILLIDNSDGSISRKVRRFLSDHEPPPTAIGKTAFLCNAVDLEKPFVSANRRVWF